MFIQQLTQLSTKTIDDPSHDVPTKDEHVGQDFMNMLDDEATEDKHISDEMNCESTECALASSEVDDRSNEYDYSDSFIDDDPLPDDSAQYYSDASKSDD